MLKTTGSSVVSASRVDDDEVVGGGGGAGAESGGSIGGSDASRKKSTKSKSRTKSWLNCTEYPEDGEGVHPSRRPHRAGLIAKETPIKVPVEYADFAFSPDLASKLPKDTGIKDHVIEPVDANRFIKPSKSPAGAPILSHLFRPEFGRIPLIMRPRFQ